MRGARDLVVALVLAILARPATAQEPMRTAASSNPEVDLLWGVQIPLRDGVHLNATIFKPKGMVERLPVVFTLTPYIGDTYHDRGTYFARNGYVFALVDVRGRGNSEGHFTPFQNEGRDGYDVVEWLAQQEWSNGKIAMWGGSYAGFDQWSTLKELPPHLATIVPAASVGIGVDAPFFKGIADPYEEQWAMFTAGHTSNERLFNDSTFWISKYQEMFTRHIPFRDFGKLVGYPTEWFRICVEHPTLDAYWRAMMPNAEQYRRITVPVLTITGAYDGDQAGALHYYTMHMRHGPTDVTSRHYLVIGPWDHAGTRTPKKAFDGLTFGDASLVDLNRLHKDWYDWVLKAGPRPPFLKDRVAYYVVGAEEWRYAPALPAAASGSRRLYLGGSGQASDAFHSGTLGDSAPRDSSRDTYVYDPLDVRPAERETERVENSITDQRYALNLYGSGLVYHSEPLVEDIDVTGIPRLVVWLGMDVPDTDFQAMIYEIRRDGTSVLLSSDVLRARYRESLEKEVLAKPREIQRYELDSFNFFSRRLAKGSRLRLVFGASNSIYRQKNYNSGGVVANESGQDARTAHVSLYHGPQHSSFLELPRSN
jgi:putative CocE/NonD family hydrolase